MSMRIILNKSTGRSDVWPKIYTQNTWKLAVTYTSHVYVSHTLFCIPCIISICITCTEKFANSTSRGFFHFLNVKKSLMRKIWITYFFSRLKDEFLKVNFFISPHVFVKKTHDKVQIYFLYLSLPLTL